MLQKYYTLFIEYANSLTPDHLLIIIVTLAVVLLYVAFRLRSMILVVVLIFFYMISYAIYTSGAFAALLAMTQTGW
ncbi:MAG: hypothetical protein Q8Q23_01950 [bacterium]|nr:hypothetical protein [bacterium]